MASCHASNLPDDILKEIFHKLSISTLFQCKQVCKSWRSTVHELLALDTMITSSDRNQPSSLFFCFCEQQYHTNFSWIECHGKSLYVNPLAKLQKLPLGFTIVNSCKGLVLINHFQVLPTLEDPTLLVPAIKILNPMTGEYMSFPPCETERYMKMALSGLGFCHKSNQFKVVRITGRRYQPRGNNNSNDEHWKAEVYCLGTGSTWRSTKGVVPQSWTNSPHPSPVALVHESLYWFMEDPDTGDNRIWGFDLESEQFRSIPLPPSFQSGGPNRFYCYSLNVGVFRDRSLYFCYSVVRYRLETWVLNESEQSWSRLFYIHSSIPYARVVRILPNGDVFMSNEDDELILMHKSSTPGLADKRYHIVKQLQGHASIRGSINYHPSLTSLRDVVGEADSTRVLNANSTL